MKILTSPLILLLAFVAIFSAGETGETNARELGRIGAEGIPKCLHVGEAAEVRIWPELEAKGDAFDFTLSTDNGEVSVTPARVNSHDTSARILFRGEKFGRERVVIRAPGNPYVAPLTAFVRILPSIEPPRGLTTQVTENFLRTEPDKYGEWQWREDGRRKVREVILSWQPKDGVDNYYIELFTFDKRPLGRYFKIPGSDRKFAVTVLPGERYYWKITASISFCKDVDVPRPESPLVPFDA